ncbi:pleiomorphic adenoma gene X [Sardina pilchardus]|uniref:pleiomorphic adenoma gene X n=1 Tax=Sardina pilchardus TaxID=27697 RepID=UPI002E0EB53F
MYHGKDHLNSHLQTHDPNKQNLQCEECGKHYNTRLGYRRHVATHAASSTGDLTCKVCRQSFDSMPALLEHLSTHTGRPPPAGTAVRERRHPCDHCDRRFYTRKDVRRHAVVHTGRRDFLCPHCAQRFGRRDHLTRHLKKSHAQDPSQLAHMAQGAMKEEPSPTLGPVTLTKDATEAFSMSLYNPQHLQSASTSGLRHHHHHHHHHHSLVPGSLSAPLGVGCSMEPPKLQQQQQQPQLQQQQYLQPSRYQSGSTSYLKAEMENLLAELQCGPPAPQAAAPASSSRPGDLFPEGFGQDPHFPLRNSAFANTDPTSAANMDLSHLLGFLPFGLPPYSSPLSTGGLVMGYSTTTTAANSSASSSQVSGPLPSFQLQQPQESQTSGPLNQLPAVFSPGFSSHTLPHTLPRFHQAFQQ